MNPAGPAQHYDPDQRKSGNGSGRFCCAQYNPAMPRFRRFPFKLLTALSVILFLITAILRGWSFDNRRLSGGYILERFESGLYYVKSDTNDRSPGGTFEGTINKIGWTADRILANVTRIYRGDPDGWYVLSVKTGEIRGPLSDGEIAADPSLRTIQCHAPD
jgi:hypothetical protein